MANQVVVEISARHVHVSKEDLETLFGKLLVKKELELLAQRVNSLQFQFSVRAEKQHRLSFLSQMLVQSALLLL